MMLTPCWPSAGPTGGAGVALPAGIWSLTMATTFFMTPPRASDLFDLREVQFHRRLPAEDRHQHPHLLLLRQNLVDKAAEVHERTGVDPNRGALLVGNPELRGLIAQLSQDRLDLAVLEGQRLAAGPHKSGDPGRVPDDVPGVVVLDLDLVLRGDEDPEDFVLHRQGRHAALEVGANLVLIPGIGMDDNPAPAVSLGRRQSAFLRRWGLKHPLGGDGLRCDRRALAGGG